VGEPVRLGAPPTLRRRRPSLVRQDHNAHSHARTLAPGSKDRRSACARLRPATSVSVSGGAVVESGELDTVGAGEGLLQGAAVPRDSSDQRVDSTVVTRWGVMTMTSTRIQLALNVDDVPPATAFYAR
jgi:hypothetical protein